MPQTNDETTSPTTGRGSEHRTAAHTPPFRPRFDPNNVAFLDETIAFWQPRTARKLTREDAREMIENVAGFFSILLEWREKQERVRDEVIALKK